MPTLQAMHRALAKHPMLQVELFLLLDELVHRDLCCMNAFIGVRRYGIRDKQPVREDDFASSMQIGIAQFPRSALKPLEAQGRGFTHGVVSKLRGPRSSFRFIVLITRVPIMFLFVSFMFFHRFFHKAPIITYITWSRKDHFCASNESCASEAVVYEGCCYRARRRRTQQMVPAGAGGGAAGGLYFAI